MGDNFVKINHFIGMSLSVPAQKQCWHCVPLTSSEFIEQISSSGQKQLSKKKKNGS